MPLELPATFAFSQSSLQAYEDCARRFWLSFVERLPWPAVEASPIHEYERQMRLGSDFHQAVERAENGIDTELIASRLSDPLDLWFQDYQTHRPADLPDPQAYPDLLEAEQILSIPFGGYRLAAKYDLLAVQGEEAGDKQVTIVDWKTSRKATRAEFLRQKLQSVVYPYVLVEASQRLPWGPVEPEQVRMVYWFTAAPDVPQLFSYSADQHMANRNRLNQLLAEILAGGGENDFPKVPDTPQNRNRLCGYCVYRSRCDRGEAAASLDELDDLETFAIDFDSALEFTLDDVEELAF